MVRLPWSATKRSPRASAASAPGSQTSRLGGRTTVPRRSADPVAGHGVDVRPDHRHPEAGAVRGRHQAHAAVGGIGDEEISGGVHGQPGGIVEPAATGRPPVTGEAGHTGAGRRGGGAGGGDLLDRRRRPEGDEQVAGRIEGQRHRFRVADRVGARSPGDGGDVTRLHAQAEGGAGPGRHLPHPTVVGVGDEEIPGSVLHDRARRVELGTGCRLPVPGEPGRARPDQGRGSRCVGVGVGGRTCRGSRPG